MHSVSQTNDRAQVEEIRERVKRALSTVGDPEMPAVSLIELGMLHEIRVHVERTGAYRIEVDLIPTYVGCPALALMRRDVETAVKEVPGVSAVDVRFVHEPKWSTDRILSSARAKLEAYGIAPPPCLRMNHSSEWRPRCPYCGSSDTLMENAFGPTSCRSIFYCRTCRNPFEAIKPIGRPISLPR